MNRLAPSTLATRTLAALALVTAGGSLASTAAAQPVLESGFGGPNDYGNQCLSPNDDSSSRLIDITPAFPGGLNFFGTRYSSVYVNTNGNITFGDPVGTYTPEAFPIADQPMIAPYWADVDIRGTACEFGEGDEWTTCLIPPGDINGVYWALEPRRMIVTWDRVGYFACRDDLQMTFQLILTAADGGCGGSGDFDVEFRYTQCGWNTGEASGGVDGFSIPYGGTCTSDAACESIVFDDAHCEDGTCWQGVPSQAGFDAGNRRDFVEIPGSRTSEIHTILCEMSNVGELGVWRFQIRSGSVICPGAGEVCETGMEGVCADGRTRCVADHTECRPVVESTSETCDLLDNDCDGTVDDGDICPGASECVMGTCVATCFEGACPAGLECEDASGLCVEEGCVGVECPEGQRCTHGVCGDACAGIVCPYGLSCQAGRCVDLCEGASCARGVWGDACGGIVGPCGLGGQAGRGVDLCEGASCDDCNACNPADGSCMLRCTPATCGPDQTCAPDGVCIESACADVTCAPATHCVAGECVDDCEGVLCPTGQECVRGECDAIVVDAGMPMRDAAVVADAGMSELDAGSDASSAFDAGVDACMGFACNGGSNGGRRGCACAVPGAGQSNDGAAGASAILVLGLAWFTWRRRR